MKFVAEKSLSCLAFVIYMVIHPLVKINKITAIVYLKKKKEERKIIILDDRVNRNA